ncbi:SHOCT domain-containing protein [Rathayibacter sp. YIM 133350]|uniref:SHOCT domain-containing protein n=1 Tax=Rathayibacter sp. YIM 133350 TaxID=3131992 RepID=UPI00307DFF5F
MLIGRRFGRPGLIGTIARTAVITGTAAMTAGAVAHRQQKKYAAQDAAAARAADGSQGVAETGESGPGASSGSHAGASVPESAPPASGGGSLSEKLDRLAALHESGALSDQEFATAKAALLAP